MHIFIQSDEPQYPEFVVCRNKAQLKKFLNSLKKELGTEKTCSELLKIFRAGDGFRLGWFYEEV